MLRVFFLLVLALLPTPVPAQGISAQEYPSKELAEAAAAYRQELRDSMPPEKRQPALIPRLRRDADEEYRARRYPQAIEDLTRAIAFGADDGLIWLRLAQSMAASGNDRLPAA